MSDDLTEIAALVGRFFDAFTSGPDLPAIIEASSRQRQCGRPAGGARSAGLGQLGEHLARVLGVQEGNAGAVRPGAWLAVDQPHPGLREAGELGHEMVKDTLNVLLKYEADIEATLPQVSTFVSKAGRQGVFG